MAGAFRRPKAIYRHWNWPCGVRTAVRGPDFSSSGTCQYPLDKSILVRNFAWPTLSIRSSIRAMGNPSGIVEVLSLRKSQQNLVEPSGFGTRTTGEAKGLELGSITPRCTIKSISFLIRFAFSGLTLYGERRKGFVSGNNWILWVHKVVFPGISLKMSVYLDNITSIWALYSGSKWSSWKPESISDTLGPRSVKWFYFRSASKTPCSLSILFSMFLSPILTSTDSVSVRETYSFSIFTWHTLCRPTFFRFWVAIR